MFIRLFAYAIDETKAKMVLDDVIKAIKFDIEGIDYLKCEPYWKMDGIYEMELKITLKRKLSDTEFNAFLENVSDRWMLFGTPPDEMLTSITMEGCSYIKNGVYLLNVLM